MQMNANCGEFAIVERGVEHGSSSIATFHGVAVQELPIFDYIKKG